MNLAWDKREEEKQRKEKKKTLNNILWKTKNAYKLFVGGSMNPCVWFYLVLFKKHQQQEIFRYISYPGIKYIPFWGWTSVLQQTAGNTWQIPHKGEQVEALIDFFLCEIHPFGLGKKATIHQVTTMLAISKMHYFQVMTTC